MTHIMKFLLPVILLSLAACGIRRSPEVAAKAKVDILNTEKAFAKMAKEKGVAEAFYFYAADDAVVRRGEKLVKGREEIKTYYRNWPYSNVELTWEPDYVDASADGTLGYTYGTYQFSAIDKSGKKIFDQGVFHTVWKKQPDGSWRFTWD
jgi:ketosteroid isomerase-like protein